MITKTIVLLDNTFREPVEFRLIGNGEAELRSHGAQGTSLICCLGCECVPDSNGEFVKYHMLAEIFDACCLHGVSRLHVGNVWSREDIVPTITVVRNREGVQDQLTEQGLYAIIVKGFEAKWELEPRRPEFSEHKLFKDTVELYQKCGVRWEDMIGAG